MINADTRTNTKHTKYYHSVSQLDQLPRAQRDRLAQVEKIYAFRTNDYYLSLIDWDDPDDPIRQLIIPQTHELEKWGHFDPSDEINFTILQGLEHKYTSTALLLVSNVCGGICRYCFRKRVFISKHGEILTDLPAAIDYIRKHTEITNVLLTGGDPLVLSTDRLKKIIDELLPINHVQILRIGTKMTAFNPYRIIDDPALPNLLGRCVDAGKQIYIMTHFNHAREITPPAIEAVNILHHAGAVLANQTPLIRGVNDHPNRLADLFRQLSFIGVPPYYVFQCRPASGNKYYAVPVEQGYQIFEQARSQVSGLGKRARFVMSHATGKIEVVGITDERIYLKYHRAANDTESGKFMIFKRNPDAYWFDDYEEAVHASSLDWHYKAYGPE